MQKHIPYSILQKLFFAFVVYLLALYPVSVNAEIDECDTNIPHPGFIYIYENDILQERIHFSDSKSPFETSMITMGGKWCMWRMPIVAVRQYVSYYDSKNNRVAKESPLRERICESMKTYNKDGEVIAYHDSFCRKIENNQ